MAVSIVVNGTTYSIPTTGDTGWGSTFTTYQQALGSLVNTDHATLQAIPNANLASASENATPETVMLRDVNGNTTVVQLATSGDIVAVYKSNGTTSTGASGAVANSSTIILNFDTSAIDTHTAVTTGTAWHFTVPSNSSTLMTGNSMYMVSSSVNFSDLTGATTDIKLDVYVNGSFAARLARFQGTVSTNSGVSGSTVLQLNDADTVDIRLTHDNGSTRHVDSNARVSIHRLRG